MANFTDSIREFKQEAQIALNIAQKEINAVLEKHGSGDYFLSREKSEYKAAEIASYINNALSECLFKIQQAKNYTKIEL